MQRVHNRYPTLTDSENLGKFSGAVFQTRSSQTICTLGSLQLRFSSWTAQFQVGSSRAQKA
jgi:hypothetical protein